MTREIVMRRTAVIVEIKDECSINDTSGDSPIKHRIDPKNGSAAQNPSP
jgi:hypothetical protein